MEQYRGLEALARFLGRTHYTFPQLVGKKQSYYRRPWNEGSDYQPTPAQMAELAEATGIPIPALWCHLYQVRTEDVKAILAAIESQGVDMREVAELVIERAAIRDGTE